MPKRTRTRRLLITILRFTLALGASIVGAVALIPGAALVAPRPLPERRQALMTRLRLWWPVICLALRSREARRRLYGIVWRHSPALTLEMWRSLIAAVFLVAVFGSWYALIVLRLTTFGR